MKLIYRILLRLSLALLAVLTVWTVFFYFTMIDEINDEVDDALEDYSETIIIRSLAGKELPSKNDGSNNSYSIRPITRKKPDNTRRSNTTMRHIYKGKGRD